MAVTQLDSPLVIIFTVVRIYYPAHFDLTSDLEGNQTYYFDSGSGFTPTTDFDVAMSYVMDNLGTLGNGYSNEYEIQRIQAFQSVVFQLLGWKTCYILMLMMRVARSTTLYYQMVKST